MHGPPAPPCLVHSLWSLQAAQSRPHRGRSSQPSHMAASLCAQMCSLRLQAPLSQKHAMRGQQLVAGAAERGAGPHGGGRAGRQGLRPRALPLLDFVAIPSAPWNAARPQRSVAAAAFVVEAKQNSLKRQRTAETVDGGGVKAMGRAIEPAARLGRPGEASTLTARAATCRRCLGSTHTTLPCPAACRRACTTRAARAKWPPA